MLPAPRVPPRKQSLAAAVPRHPVPAAAVGRRHHPVLPLLLLLVAWSLSLLSLSPVVYQQSTPRAVARSGSGGRWIPQALPISR
jgi:hypothetical protein